MFQRQIVGVGAVPTSPANVITDTLLRNALQRAPDLTVGIVSPSESGAGDVQQKISEYLAAGTQIVWVVYGKTLQVMAHYQNGAVKLFTADQSLDAGDLLPGFQVRVADLFPA